MTNLRLGAWSAALLAPTLAFPASLPTSAPSTEERIQKLEDGIKHRFEWGGDGEISLNSYEGRGPGNQPSQEAVIRTNLRPKIQIDEGYAATLDLLLRADTTNSTRNTVRLEEGYVSTTLGKRVTARAGKMIYNWGSSFLYSPIDILNPRDYYDFTHVDKLGVVALDATWSIGSKWSIDAGILPVFQPNIISDSTSRWIDYSSLINSAIVPNLQLPGSSRDYSVSFSLKDRNPTIPQFFTKASYKGVGADLTLLYAYRYNPVPAEILFNSSVGYDFINSRPTVAIEGVPYYSKEHVLGLSASVPVFGTLAYLDGAYSIPTGEDEISSQQQLANLNGIGLGSSLSAAGLDSLKRSSSVTIVAGISKQWSRVRGLIQYGRIWYLGNGNQPGALFQRLGGTSVGSMFNPTDVYDFFSGTLMPGISWDTTRNLSLKGGALFNLKSHGIMATAGLDYKIKGGMSADLSYYYIRGQDGSLLNYYSKNSRLGLNLSFVF